MSTRRIDTTEGKGIREEEEENVARTNITPTDAKKNHLAIIIALVSLYILWGATYLGVRVALQSFPPFLLAGVRALIAGILMFPYLLAPGAPMPSRQEWLGATIVGAL